MAIETTFITKLETTNCLQIILDNNILDCYDQIHFHNQSLTLTKN